jgi:1,4-dihydroxy-2-naphthoyl-CoA hydrolase
MGIWTQPFTIEQLNHHAGSVMPGHLGIIITETGDNFLKASMPVDHRTRQPAGLLHGGASVTLAETLGSIGSWMCIDREKQQCVGLEINANHIRAVSDGTVYGKATPLHIGKSTHVWEIKITNENGQLVCVSRITVAILEKKTSNL